jgi:hypothetical protein
MEYAKQGVRGPRMWYIDADSSQNLESWGKTERVVTIMHRHRIDLEFGALNVYRGS